MLVPIISFLIVGSGCSPFKPLRIESLEYSSAYDKLFPYHVEVCALSRIKPVNGVKGNRAGHGVLFLEGACRNETSNFPQVELCSEKVQQDFGASGVGISVNKVFRNVNWVAVPGQHLFYYGNLSEDEILTEEVRETIIDRAVTFGIYRGVSVHERYLAGKSEQESLERYLARISIGTDYALRIGRSVLCMKIPVTRSMMQEIIFYLNRQNQKYASGEEEFRWSALSDNCTHTIYNALASAHMVNPKLVQAGRIRRFFNLAVPANAVASIAELASPDPLGDIREIVKNKRLRLAFDKHYWLPMRHGTLLSALPIHEKNKLYHAEPLRFETFVLKSRSFKSRRRLLQQAFSDDRFTDLRSNLTWFEQKYQIITNRCQTQPLPQKMDFEFYQNYCRYIEEQLEEVREQITLL